MKAKVKRMFHFSFLGFLVLMLFAAIFRPLISDEIHEGNTVYSLTQFTPYADKIFYKNLLGYYLKLPFLFISDSWWTNLITSRVYLAVIFALTIFFVGRKLLSTFSEMAVSGALLLFAFFTQNVTHAASYRVDMLTACFGVFSLLAILEKRFILAGALAALSFFVSQKGVFYCVAGTAAVFYATRDVENLKRYIGAGLAVGVAYVAFWAIFADLGVILYSIFLRDVAMAGSFGYDIKHYWARSFFANPIFWITSFLAFAYFIQDQKSYFNKIVFSYTTLVFLFCLMMGQPWPYFFVLLSPFLLFNMCFFLEKIIESNGASFTMIVVILGVGISSYHLITKHTFSNDDQKYNITLMEKILKPGEAYLAGINLHPSYRQIHPRLEVLQSFKREEIKKWPDSKIVALLSELKQRPVKLMVSNYRLVDLGPRISGFLYKNYRHMWANIYTYSLVLPTDEKKINNHFGGEFMLEGAPQEGVEINGTRYLNGQIVKLNQGSVNFQTSQEAYLKFFPAEIKPFLIEKYKEHRSLGFTYEL